MSEDLKELRRHLENNMIVCQHLFIRDFIIIAEENSCDGKIRGTNDKYNCLLTRKTAMIIRKTNLYYTISCRIAS